MGTLNYVSPPGTTLRNIRVDHGLWELFGAATARAGTDRSEALRAFIAWYIRAPLAELPERPPAPGDHVKPISSANTSDGT